MGCGTVTQTEIQTLLGMCIASSRAIPTLLKESIWAPVGGQSGMWLSGNVSYILVPRKIPLVKNLTGRRAMDAMFSDFPIVPIPAILKSKNASSAVGTLQMRSWFSITIAAWLVAARRQGDRATIQFQAPLLPPFNSRLDRSSCLRLSSWCCKMQLQVRQHSLARKAKT